MRCRVRGHGPPRLSAELLCLGSDTVNARQQVRHPPLPLPFDSVSMPRAAKCGGALSMTGFWSSQRSWNGVTHVGIEPQPARPVPACGSSRSDPSCCTEPAGHATPRRAAFPRGRDLVSFWSSSALLSPFSHPGLTLREHDANARYFLHSLPIKQEEKSGELDKGHIPRLLSPRRCADAP